ncbi:MAG TPA: tetratricopeptide repeat protein [Candidatus Cybelea sp.]|jgi:predicted ATPase/DNA-binding XRE family transcriptional regulator|nr:tetratricopeptide repeat protein [Candidatus Cybelea sp.]
MNAIVTAHRERRKAQQPAQIAGLGPAGAPKLGPNCGSIVENERRSGGPPEFGTLLRSFRLTAGLSQEALAERAGLSAHGVSALERGYRRTPQRGTLALLAGALALSDAQSRELEAAAARWVLLRDGAKASVLVGPWPDAPSSHLPLSLASFVGRGREVDQIAALVRQHRLVTLTGSGGVGKTQTALQVATALGEAAAGAVCFVGLSPVGDPSLVPVAIASALRVQEMPNRPLVETLLEHLRDKALLLMLDNCEHVVAQAATVAEALLAGCPQLRILATSREPLRFAGEHTYRLPSLSIPSREAAARLRASDAAAYGAIELFCDRARAVDHRFALGDENASAVAELCRKLDGIPLAIELAAARVNSLSIMALTERLEDRFRILTGGRRTALPRQQTMRAAIDWSYDSLSAPEQRVFERLSVFAGGCTLAGAEAVCAGGDVATADIANLISSLVDKSMVVADFDGTDPRYWLFESFRQYASEKLVASGERQAVAQRHARAYLDLAERLEYSPEPADRFQVIARRELDDWRAALQWTLAQRHDVALGQRLVGVLRLTWSGVAVLEGRHWVRLALDLVDERTPSKVLARLNHAATMIAVRLHEYAVALASGESAAEHYRIAGESLGVASAQTLTGVALEALGRVEEAQARLQEALAIARRSGDRRLLAFTLRCLGSASAAAGDIVAARDYLAQARPIHEAKIGSISVEADLSEYEFRAGNVELALGHAMDSLGPIREFGHPDVLSHQCALISGYLVALDRYDEAEEFAREILDLARGHALTVVAAWALQRLGAVAALRPQARERAPHSHMRAARILGFVDARIAALGSVRGHVGQLEYDRVLKVLHAAMRPDVVANLMLEGETMTEEQALNEALRDCPSAPRIGRIPSLD